MGQTSAEKANKEYNDNVFRLLFKDENKSVELYNAINGTNYDANAVSMNILQSPLFFGTLRNDISFTLDDKFVILIEHQSTINPNMPLRCLLYIAEIYEQLIDKGGIYKAKPMSIENPEFYVIYNGKAEFPEKKTLKLSELYRARDGREPNLELIVTVYNVNHGYNENIMRQSKTLDDYAAFIAKVREYEKSGIELTAALHQAVEYCVKNNILREFLEANGGEVVGILKREWNLDDALKIREEVLGKDHPDTATTYNNIAGVYYNQDKYDEALKLYLKSYNILFKKLGPDHPHTIDGINNARTAYNASGLKQPFEEWLQQNTK